jgi:hypothetical protein
MAQTGTEKKKFVMRSEVASSFAKKYRTSQNVTKVIGDICVSYLGGMRLKSRPGDL